MVRSANDTARRPVDPVGQMEMDLVSDQEPPFWEMDKPEGESKMSENELLKAIQQEISWADDDQNEEEIDRAIDYYERILPGVTKMDEDDCNEYSDMVSPEVQNAIEATLAEIMPGFYGDLPVVFLPNGPMDDQQADEESRIINHVFITSNKGYTILQRSIKDALLLKDAFIKIHWDDSQKASGRRLTGVPPQMVPQMMSVIEGGEQEEDGTYTVDIMEKNKTGRPIHEWVPCDQILVNSDHANISLDEARFVCHRRRISTSDLIAAGYPREAVETLTDGTDDNDAYLRRKATHENKTGHDSTKNVVVAESYYRVDADGDGIAELRRVVTAGGTDGSQKILDQEPWPEQPFAHGVAFFAPRGWRGVSLEERLEDNQDYKSDMMRQIMDAGWRNLNQRIGVVERMANVNDLNGSRRGGTVRLKDPSALVPIPDVSLPHQSFALLDVLDKMRRESGGGAVDTAPSAQEIGADSAHGLERIMSAIEETNAMVAKNIAETLVTETYQKTHRLLRHHWNGVINAKVRGSWLEQVPQQWAERNDVQVAVGLSTGTRLRQAANLAQVIQQQSADIAAGMDGLLVSPQTLYRARVNYSRLMGETFPEQYWVDPNSPEAQQAQQQKAQQAQEQAQAQQEQLAQQAQLMQSLEQIKGQAKITSDQIAAQSKKYSDDLDHIQKTIDQRLKLIELNAAYDEEEVPDSVGNNNANS